MMKVAFFWALAVTLLGMGSPPCLLRRRLRVRPRPPRCTSPTATTSPVNCATAIGPASCGGRALCS